MIIWFLKNRFYLIDIHEAITQQLRIIDNTIIHIDKFRNIGDYDLHDYTRYESNDYLTIPYINKAKDINREILTDNIISFIDYITF